MNILVSSLFFVFLLQMVFFVFAAYFKTDKLTDLSYGLTFVLLVFYLLLLNAGYFLASILLFSMIAIWGTRLSSFLFSRILKINKDERFDGIREDFFKFLRFWVLQALSIWIIMLPSIIVFSSKASTLSFSNYLGMILWLVGILIEGFADHQKSSFKKQGAEGFIRTGLWKYSRHPNYFGEILCWTGVFVFSIPYLSGLSWLSAISPVYISFLLIFVTGIPPLEKSHEKKYGKDFLAYKKNTSVMIPWPPRY